MAIHEESHTLQPQTTMTSAQVSVGDELENTLRPQDFDNYIGQTEVKQNMKVFVAAAKERQEPLDHTLLYGPPGLGKTTLARILSNEMGTALRMTSGPALEKPGDLAAILTNLKPHDFLFIDEIHRLRLPVEEILYSAMEDFAIDLVVGKGPTARTMRMEIPPFTLLGATTRASMLSGPLRDRFGHIEKLRYYEQAELEQILLRSADILEVNLPKNSAKILAQTSRRTPRIANRLLKRMRDFAQVQKSAEITPELLHDSLKNLSIDTSGLDRGDQEYLTTLCEKFAGGPVGLSTIAAAIGEDENTIEDMIEPFLIREGFLQRTPRGRMGTEKAFQHLGLASKKGGFQLTINS